MAYGLRYTLTQILRDGTSSVVNIYEKDYTAGIVTPYDAVELKIQSNASEDEPMPQIISSQLNISFVIPLENTATIFPNLLGFDDRKYYVEYKNETNILWVGYLFNDYMQVPFTTGYVQVDLVATDGLKLLEYAKYNLTDLGSTNATTKLINVIATCLNLIAYPTQLKLVTSCSYYAATMSDRGAGTANEPFNQTYQYRRDYIGLTCYQVLENIVKSFGCRLFQSDGKWQLLTINEQANTTQYYTEYTISPTISVSASGTLDNNVTINPYVLGNVHFIDDSQTKIIRKGYPKIILTSKWQGSDNYFMNGDFKAYTDQYSNTGVTGWYRGKTGGPLASANNFFVNNLSDNNDIFMAIYSTGVSSYLHSGDNLSTTAYLPFLDIPSFTVAFQYKIQEIGQRAKLAVELIDSTTGVSWFYNQADEWQTGTTWTDTYVFIDYQGNGGTVDALSPWSSYSKEFSLEAPHIPGGAIKGYVRIYIFVDDAAGGITNINVRGFKNTQQLSIAKGMRVTRSVSDIVSTTKEITQPYGFWNYGVQSNNFKGVLFNSAGAYLQNWYKYGYGGTYGTLQELMALQYSNLLSKNFGTLEGDLGAFKTSKGLNYLNKNITVTDASTNALSYNGKKFLINRADITPYNDEVNSLQIIEITNTNNDSSVTVEYLSE